MSRITKAIILGVLTGILGLIFYLVPVGYKLDERIGLHFLFKMRGPRQAPPDVIIVGIDSLSADKLNLPNDPQKWPHDMHAQLTENLAKEGAGVIIFDIFFGESRSTKDDILFANAMSKAGNVVLVESIKKEKVILKDEEGSSTGRLNIEELVSPISPLAQSSVAMAPFPLPKVPVTVSQYWTFKTTAGDTPTLPPVTLQVFALEVYEDFLRILKDLDPSHADELPHKRDELIDAKAIVKVMKVVKDTFENEPIIAEKMLGVLENSQELTVDPRKKFLLKSLIKMYEGPNSHFLNFYGPPHTISTVSYYHVLQKGNDQKQPDFNGKAVFVGSSEMSQPEQKDGFYTVFSDSRGLDISGVEIAATAFANLLQDMPVRPLKSHSQFITILLWGIGTGILCRLVSNTTAAVSVIAASILFFLAALSQFSTGGIWYPLVVPLFFQTPLAFFGAMAWKYCDANKERQNIRRAFSYYLPDEVVDKISKNIADVKMSSQVVHGTCLSTDSEQYTSLSETMAPQVLSSFINKYYQVVFEPVKQYGGTVSNVVGDSMLAVWVTLNPDSSLRKQACLAAVDIRSAVNCFNQSYDSVQMQTRIGLHSGHILVGNIGAMDHYEYRPVGDIVNTTARIEGLNKHLGTQILLSEDVLNHLNGFLTRELGEFLLAGKSQPVVLHELVSRTVESTQNQRDLCVSFSKARDAFKRQSWSEASEKFRELIDRFGEDGPSLFFLKLCKQYSEGPQGESWDGIIRLDRK